MAFKQEIPMRWVEVDNQLKEVGDFSWFAPSGDFVWLTYKRIDGFNQSIRVTTDPKLSDGPNTWLWDGVWDKPTLTPSIRSRHLDGKTVLWHGYITKGVMQILDE